MAQTVCVIVSAVDRERLEAIVADRNQRQKCVERARIVLASADRGPAQRVAQSIGVSRPTVWRWQQRFAEGGVDGLLRDKTRKPGKAPIAADKTAQLVALTCTEPPHQATHWTGRAMAKAMGLSLGSVQRIRRAHHLQPHRLRTFKRSRDPSFAAKLTDIVGLYIDPPAHTVVLSLDEKSQIQALDRTQPGLPIKPGRCQTMTHDYKRHGTTTLFAGMNMADGSILSTFMPTHNHQDWIRFLKLIQKQTPQDKDVHLVLDNYSAHKTPEVLRWLTRHRFHLHFTPTSSSWCNPVERFFRNLTEKCVRRGVFHSVEELQESIQRYIEQQNRQPKPYIWTAKARDILEKVKRAWSALTHVNARCRARRGVWRASART